jgi:acyl-CoA oxidase
MGIFANHAVLYAQVIISNKSFGVQPFMVQIRDMTTHEPLPGVTVGDIGPKFGFIAKDNGFLRLENVRIPRENILGKYCKVTKTGEFKKLGNEKVAYTVMMNTRSLIACDLYHYLSASVVIAVRYSLIHTQFKGPDSIERPVLDYQLQMHKLFPPLADAYVFALGSHKIKQLVEANMTNVLEKGDFSITGETHLVLCATKAYVSMGCYHGIEKTRLACGGHGFSHYSGIPALKTEQASTATLEGETTVMYLQVARFLLKSYFRFTKGEKLKGQVEYFKEAEDLLAQGFKQTSNLRDMQNLKELLTVSAYHFVKDSASELLALSAKGIDSVEAINNYIGVSMVEATQNHTALYLFTAAIERLNKFTIKCPKSKAVVETMIIVFGINLILEKPAALIESGFLKPAVFKS